MKVFDGKKTEFYAHQRKMDYGKSELFSANNNNKMVALAAIVLTKKDREKFFSKHLCSTTQKKSCNIPNVRQTHFQISKVLKRKNRTLGVLKFSAIERQHSSNRAGNSRADTLALFEKRYLHGYDQEDAHVNLQTTFLFSTFLLVSIDSSILSVL